MVFISGGLPPKPAMLAVLMMLPLLCGIMLSLAISWLSRK